MRLLYAVQFEVISSEASGRDISERVFQSLESWICNWYRYRKNLTVSFPSASGILNPCETHELIITREISRSNEASHLSVSWTYPDDNDGNLLWHSKCDISQYGDLTEFSFQLLLESLQFYITPVEFSLRRPRVIATLLRQFVCTHGDTRLSIEPQGLSAAAIPQFVRTRLLSRNRRTPVVVVSRTTESGKWQVDPADLAEHLAGIAEVFILDDKW